VPFGGRPEAVFATEPTRSAPEVETTESGPTPEKLMLFIESVVTPEAPAATRRS